MSISSWSTTAADNDSAPPNGAPEGWAPSAVNDTIRQQMADHRTQWENAQWFDWGYTHTYASATSFTIAGDKTSTYTVGARVKVVATTPGTIYGRIAASSYGAPNTTVTVAWVSGSLSNEALTVSLGTFPDLASTDPGKGADLISYPLSAEEIAAGVTPVAPRYPVGDIRRYGGIDDASTNTVPAIEDLILVAEEAAGMGVSGFVCKFPGLYGYAIESGVVFPPIVSIDMDVPVIYTGASAEAAVTIGDAGDIIQSQKLRLRVRKDVQSDWTSDSCIGLEIINAKYCDIEITECSGFTIGGYLIGDSTGFAYNTLRLGELRNNRYQLKCTNNNSGYINENVFIGGELNVTSSVNSSVSRFGVWITSDDGGYVNNNNNVFIKPSFELGAATASQEAVAIWIEHGHQNHFLYARFENDDIGMRCSNAAARNTVQVGYGTGTYPLEQLGTASENIILESGSAAHQYFTNPVRLFTNLGGIAGGTTDAVTVSGTSWRAGNSATDNAASSTGCSFVASTGLLTIAAARMMGVYVDTSTVKDFLVTRAGTSGGRVYVVAYDSGGSIISDNDVLGALGASFSEVTSFGASFRTGADSLSSVYFRVESDVAEIFVGIGGGTAAAVISSFGVFSRPGQDQVYSWAGT